MVRVLKRMLTPDLTADEYKAVKKAIASIEGWERLKKEVYMLKRNQSSENQDYRTGFISALSNVEGVIAILEGGKDGENT